MAAGWSDFRESCAALLCLGSSLSEMLEVASQMVRSHRYYNGSAEIGSKIQSDRQCGHSIGYQVTLSSMLWNLLKNIFHLEWSWLSLPLLSGLPWVVYYCVTDMIVWYCRILYAVEPCVPINIVWKRKRFDFPRNNDTICIHPYTMPKKLRLLREQLTPNASGLVRWPKSGTTAASIEYGLKWRLQ